MDYLEEQLKILKERVDLLERFVANQLKINDILRDMVVNKYTEEELEEYLNKKKDELSEEK